MADIQLRFHKDMLVLSAPIDYALSQQGVDMETQAEYVSLVEPETMRDALRLHAVAGAQCLVAPTEGLTQARLAHKRMEDRASELAQAAIEHVLYCAPQHLICELGSCGLPLDASSDASRKQNIAQYENAVQTLVQAAAVAGGSANSAPIDAILLTSMRSAGELQCAIEGTRKAFGGPVFATVNVDNQGNFNGKPLDQAFEALAAADVAGIRSAAAPKAIAQQVSQLAAAVQVPIMVEIDITQPTAAQKRRASLGAPLPDAPYALPDFLADAALELRAAGAQFLRVVGQATPAYTGALAAGVFGLDAIR